MSTNCFIFCLHRGERNVLVGLHRSHYAARVLLREESLGNLDVEINAQRSGRNSDQQGQRLVAKNNQLRATSGKR